ncbi:MBL fold metallo-hydrolase [Streptomyces sp. NPDC059455]|uniref:MBL fold metallo-hydrolase n=1 Tax=Streptomyces sp. NPDC059455 TaxID=3346837 RepID=UPI0036950CF1
MSDAVGAFSATLPELARGVYAWIQPDGSWFINNAGVITGPDGTVVIDTCTTAARTSAFLTAVARATDAQPVTNAVNTHPHADHTLGNCLLPESTTVIGHPDTRSAMLGETYLDSPPPFWNPPLPLDGLVARPPTLTCRGGLTLHTGDRVIELHHPGYTAHTTGDLIAWLPTERILFAGDLVFNRITPLALAGSLTGARRSLMWIRSFAPEIIVPGHGPVLTGAAQITRCLDDIDAYFAHVQDLADRGIRTGRQPLDMAAELDPAYRSWPDSERIALNLHRAYAEHGAAGFVFDRTAAFTDAMHLSGGPIPCCV